VVWLGCFLMLLGSRSAFFLSHRNQPAFALFFDALSKDLGESKNDK